MEMQEDSLLPRRDEESSTPEGRQPEKLTDNAPEQINKLPGASATGYSPTAVVVQAWVDKGLLFLSHASNETLGACLVGLGATTYLVLGRVGLVLIGVVAGVALHATWDGGSEDVDDKQAAKERDAKRRRELGVEVVQRVWRWRENSSVNEEVSEAGKPDVKLFPGNLLDYSQFKPETAAALNTFTDAVIRDYVKYVQFKTR
jgi:hypothetical protein